MSLFSSEEKEPLGFGGLLQRVVVALLLGLGYQVWDDTQRLDKLQAGLVLQNKIQLLKMDQDVSEMHAEFDSSMIILDNAVKNYTDVHARQVNYIASRIAALKQHDKK